LHIHQQMYHLLKKSDMSTDSTEHIDSIS